MAFDSNGNWQEDEQHVENIIVGYFRDIFHTQGPVDSFTLIEAIEPMVTSDMNDSLTQAFQADEVHRTLKQMYPKKSLGPDGIPPSFYQHFWSLTRLPPSWHASLPQTLIKLMLYSYQK